MPHSGHLAGPIRGLRYETPTCSGVTDERGTFSYEDGETVAFLVGNVVVGAAAGAARLTVADLVARADGDIAKLADPGLTNIARFLQTLDDDGNPDDGVTILPAIHEIVGDRPINFRYAMNPGAAESDLLKEFSEDPVVIELLEDLNNAGVFSDAEPRHLRSPAAARNEVRRNILGIRRFRDVKIPRQNGSYVTADVYRPEGDEPVPVIMNCGVYGRAFVHHTVSNEDEREAHELMEERYFFGNPSGYEFENHESINTAAWIPRGYALVRVDGPGAGTSPGRLGVWGIDEAEAYHDAIEWAGSQAWSNGNVGLWGMSYYAMNQHAVASLAPSHLKAMIAIGTDADLYEEVMYTGGILNEEFFPFWFKFGVLAAVAGEPDAIDFLSLARENPFRDSDPSAIFGPRASVLMSPDLSDVTVPLWAVAATTHPSHFHQLGSSETYLNTPTSHKRLDFWEDWFMKSYSQAAVDEHMAFFDHWLKGIDNGIMDGPPVRLEIRTGHGASYRIEEHEWPIERTNYVRWHLDAHPSDGDGEIGTEHVHTLAEAAAGRSGSVSYSAEVDRAAIPKGAALSVMKTAPCDPGATFISAPFGADTVLAGYFKLVIWVASSSEDLDLHASLRVLDENGREVDFCGPAAIPGTSNRFYPLTKGWLKASHRVLDRERTSEIRPKHTHRKADYSPLSPGEIVELEVEIVPSTGVVKQGQRLRLDVEPYTGVGHGMGHAYDPSYHDGATNTIYTGPEYPSYLQLPVLPFRDH
jgi:putative CocE/NonD family hydrolase